MLIEVKTKVERIVDSKTKRRIETFVVPDCELFVNAEHKVMALLSEEEELGVVNSFEIQSMRISPIKEVCNQFTGEYSFIATLKDLFTDDEGNEKPLKYKVLLWADTLSIALSNAMSLKAQGYDMEIETLKQVDYKYIEE
jgi:hypothetical protein